MLLSIGKAARERRLQNSRATRAYSKERFGAECRNAEKGRGETLKDTSFCRLAPRVKDQAYSASRLLNREEIAAVMQSKVNAIEEATRGLVCSRV